MFLNINKDELAEGQLIEFTNDQRLVFISATAGMGKSTLMSSLSLQLKKTYPSVWVFRLDLLEFSNYFEGIINQGNMDVESPVDFLLAMMDTSCKTETTVTEKNLIRKCFCKPGKIIIIVDGFDEIPDCKDVVLNLLNGLKENTSILRIFATTRPNMEKYLGSIPFKIKPFSPEEQVDCLQRIWTKDLQVSQATHHEKLKTYAVGLLRTLSVSLTSKSNQVTGIPLQIKFLAEVFRTKSGTSKIS